MIGKGGNSMLHLLTQNTPTDTHIHMYKLVEKNPHEMACNSNVTVI